MRVKKIIPILLIMLMIVSLTACGSGSGGGYTEDEQVQTEESTTTSSGKARVEMDDYQIHLDAATDTTLYGTINHSYGQDIVALNEEGEEIARMTLEGADGDEEGFKIVVPASALHDGHNPIRIKGTEKSGEVNETNTKLVSINIGSGE